MKILIIGGTGTISTAVSQKTVEMGHELFIINRGTSNGSLPEGVKIITADIIIEQDVSL